MLQIVPLQYYTSTYYYFLLVMIMVCVGLLFSEKYNPTKKTVSPNLIIFIILVLYIGFRPLSGYYFGDMTTYADFFKINAVSLTPIKSEDWLFDKFIFESSKIMGLESWFTVCAFLYIFPMYRISQKFGKSYAFYFFLLLIASFSFWSYGTNGLRNGIATSVFLLALSSNKLVFQLLWMFLACGIHSSMLLPSLAFGLTFLVKNPKYYFFGWLLSIPLSLVAGGAVQGMFAGLMDDSRSTYLTGGNVNNDSFSSTGFRWDFLLYSAAPVYNAYYFIFKKKWISPIYNKIVCVYLTSNAFWILVIKANFSNRFAYLSWFMMAVVIAYPWVQQQFVPDQTKKMAIILLAYFSFTFLMNVILAG